MFLPTAKANPEFPGALPGTVTEKPVKTLRVSGALNRLMCRLGEHLCPALLNARLHFIRSAPYMTLRRLDTAIALKAGGPLSFRLP